MTSSDNMPYDAPITRALISVSDKEGLLPFATFLKAQGIEILSTGGTAKFLIHAGIDVTDVSAVTGVPEMLDGRVKTLHPKIHGGLLARRELSEHREQMVEHGIAAIDMLVVNLYPFEQTVARSDDAEEIIENIDIGGPALIRGAAKNFAHVAVVVESCDYAEVMDAMAQHNNAVPYGLKRSLAAKAYAKSASYDSAIALWFAENLARADGENLYEGDGWPEFLLDARKQQVMRYGENPHQLAALYRTRSVFGVASAAQHQGKELSYNNINDTDAAWQLVQEFSAPAVVLIKHANPCGVAIGANAAEAFVRALACDNVSAFGGILATNQTVDKALVEAIGSLFLEVIIAPHIADDARQLLQAKKNLRVLTAPLGIENAMQIKTISGGYLVQTSDDKLMESLHCVSKIAASEQQIADMRFAFAVAKHVKSNAIVIAKDGATLGIGAGQMSRVDSVRVACDKAARAGLTTKGAVLASDAFFPFADNVEVAHAAGVSAVIQPGGSMRDAEVIAAADAVGMVMAFSGMRHFRH